MKELKMFIVWLGGTLGGAFITALWFMPFFLPKFEDWGWLFMISAIPTIIMIVCAIAYVSENWNNE